MQKLSQLQTHSYGITPDEYSCFLLVKFSLSTHHHLSNDDIIYASNFITSLYSSPLFTFTPDLLFIFLTLSNQSSIGRFALTFNSQLRHLIHSRNDLLLATFLQSLSFNSFVELFDNPFLYLSDKELLIDLLDLDHQSIISVYQTIRNQYESQHGNGVDDDEFKAETFNVCYNNICINKTISSGLSGIDGILYQANKCSQYVYIVDKSLSSSTPEIFCFDILDLCLIMTQENPINPHTNDPFSNYSIHTVKNRFRKEIALCLRFLSYS